MCRDVSVFRLLVLVRVFRFIFVILPPSPLFSFFASSSLLPPLPCAFESSSSALSHLTLSFSLSLCLSVCAFLRVFFPASHRCVFGSLSSPFRSVPFLSPSVSCLVSLGRTVLRACLRRRGGLVALSCVVLCFFFLFFFLLITTHTHTETRNTRTPPPLFPSRGRGKRKRVTLAVGARARPSLSLDLSSVDQTTTTTNTHTQTHPTRVSIAINDVINVNQ